MPLTNVFTGAHGTISLAVEGTPAQQADFKAITSAYGDTVFNPIGRVVDVELCVQTELQEFYEIGFRDINQLLPGNVHNSGKIGRAFINGSLLFLLLGRDANDGLAATIQPQFTLNLEIANPDLPTNRLKLVVTGVKFENWSLRVPNDTFIMENVTFKAIDVRIKDKDDGNDIAVAFPKAES
jgi:hypothetical protein